MATTQKMALFQRHFNSEIEEVVDSRTITFKQLSQHFHLPINEVGFLSKPFLFAKTKQNKTKQKIPSSLFFTLLTISLSFSLLLLLLFLFVCLFVCFFD